MRMAWGENARMAFNNLRENKMRSVLTVLGVVIGVTALIAVSSVLVGLDASIHDYLSEFGSDTIFIFKFNPGIHTTRPTPEALNRKPLTVNDALAIKTQSLGVRVADGRGLARVNNTSPPASVTCY